MTEALLSIGGNLGDRLANLQAVVRMLDDHDGLFVREVSSLYETEPFGVEGQPDYLNALVRVETGLAPEALLDVCQQIEAGLGRVRVERWGARTVDIDILTFGTLRRDDARLTLPHPRMAERAFVQIPLRELEAGRIEWTDEVRPFAFGWCPQSRQIPLWIHRAETGSTNDDAKRLAAAGLPNGSVVVADRQTAGRGRMGRVWRSDAGAGVWMSIVLRPDNLDARRGGLLPLAAGLAVARFLHGLGVPAQLKWPNDVLCDGRKICGILCESTASGFRLDRVVVGIGLNLFQQKEDFGPELAETATSLAMEKPELAELTRDGAAAALLSETLKAVTMMDTEKETFLAQYRDLSCLVGRTVGVIRVPNGEIAAEHIEGEVLGFSGDGALILATARGNRELASGEVTLRPAGGTQS